RRHRLLPGGDPPRDGDRTLRSRGIPDASRLRAAGTVDETAAPHDGAGWSRMARRRVGRFGRGFADILAGLPAVGPIAQREPALRLGEVAQDRLVGFVAFLRQRLEA